MTVGAPLHHVHPQMTNQDECCRCLSCALGLGLAGRPASILFALAAASASAAPAVPDTGCIQPVGHPDPRLQYAALVRCRSKGDILGGPTCLSTDGPARPGATARVSSLLAVDVRVRPGSQHLHSEGSDSSGSAVYAWEKSVCGLLQGYDGVAISEGIAGFPSTDAHGNTGDCALLST